MKMIGISLIEESGFDAYMRRIMEENKEILEALGSDFDEEGTPYWEKWGSEAKFDKEYPVD